MQRIVIVATLAALLASLGGCNSAASRMRERPAMAATLDPSTRLKIEQGMIEPGFTPEMVYLALGLPTTPVTVDLELRDGVWNYRNLNRNDRDYIRAGFRTRRVFDPDRRSDVVITEPVDDRAFPQLRDYTIEIMFRDGQVTRVRRIPL